LTFCRMAVESHGGSMWIEPNSPRGCVFVLRLPVAEDETGRSNHT
jgi:K+-sensing histidine kinase KdpD